ncbi:MAG: flagellar hook assembly protein FlgD [Chitinophagaceae bacterium]|nr:flagellar hook assembly protein FlgD [Oligoflexus sp.]
MSAITQKITPPVAGPASNTTFSDVKVDDQVGVNKTEDKKQTDFRTLITNSMDEVQKDRKAKENGDLSSSSDAEFLQKLADKSKEKRTPKNELGKDEFMKLFVTQMQHQDPLNPDNGAEMASKLAQFNGLEQMMNMNKGIEKLIAAQGADRNTQMIGYIGKEVTVDGGRVQLKGGKVGNSDFNSEVPIASATLEVRDGAGILVNQVDLGAMDAGNHSLKWDGKTHDGRPAAEGVYTYNVVARNPDGDAIPINLTSKARINGVDIKSKDGALYSDFGRVTFDQIRSVGKVGYDDNQKTAANGGSAPDAMTEVGGAVGGPPIPQPIIGKSTGASDGLDKLQAQGKLNIKKPSEAAKSDTAQIQEQEAAKVAEQRAGASAKNAEVKKAVDPHPAPSAKLNETDKEKSPPPLAT